MTRSGRRLLTFLAAAVLAGALRAAVEPAAPAPKDADDVYVYKGGRDPFLPLTGPGMGGLDVPRASGEEVDGFNPASLELKGILQTRTGRWAVLRHPGANTSFLVKDGRIEDSKRKAVTGFVGIVKEKSLVIIGPNNQVTELKLQKDPEERRP
jgi:hypothetical protein